MNYLAHGPRGGLATCSHTSQAHAQVDMLLFSHRSREPRQADLVTTSVGSLGALQILDNWLKGGFAVFFVIADMGD